jgi:uncharacterized protein (DUF924 family)
VTATQTALDAAAREVLDFWFGAPDSAAFGQAHRFWFKRDAAFDATLAARFGPTLDRAEAGELSGWGASPLGALALIVLLDQFTRNAYRNTPRAFAGDARALGLAKTLVATDDDRRLPTVHQRVFAYMPFEHDETPESQRESVRLFTALADETGDQDYLRYATAHARVIERFGRFPHRNAVLGRVSSEEEAAWLARNRGF